MSLINDMLNDLETRRARGKNDSSGPGWLVGQNDATKFQYEKASKIPRYVIFIFVLTILMMAYIVKSQWYLFDGSTSKAELVIETKLEGSSEHKKNYLSGLQLSKDESFTWIHIAVEDNTPYNIRRNNQELIVELLGIVPRLINESVEPLFPISNIAIEELLEKTSVVLTVAGDFQHEISRAPGKKSHLILKIIPLVTSQRANQDYSLLNNSQAEKKVTAKKKNNNRQIVSNEQQNIVEGKYNTGMNVVEPVLNSESSEVIGKDEGLSKKLVFKSTVVKSTANKSTKSLESKFAKNQTSAKFKKLVELTPQQKDLHTSLKASILIDQSKFKDAENLLIKHLNMQKASPKSAEVYVSFLISTQQLERAQHILLSQSNNNVKTPALLALQARLYLLRGDAQLSANLLISESPELHEHTDYYELLAQSAQRTNQYVLSEKTYRALIGVDASKGDWWVGLGVSLDAQGQSNRAMRAYKMAVNSHNITQSLQVYAQQRLSHLQVSK